MQLQRISLLFFAVLLFEHVECLHSSLSRIEQQQARDNCGSNPAWHSTSEAWVNADTDNQLLSWWQVKSSGQRGTFANELGRSFGDHMTGFECGIGAYSTCIAAGCSSKLLYHNLTTMVCELS